MESYCTLSLVPWCVVLYLFSSLSIGYRIIPTSFRSFVSFSILEFSLFTCCCTSVQFSFGCRTSFATPIVHLSSVVPSLFSQTFLAPLPPTCPARKITSGRRRHPLLPLTERCPLQRSNPLPTSKSKIPERISIPSLPISKMVPLAFFLVKPFI